MLRFVLGEEPAGAGSSSVDMSAMVRRCLLPVLLFDVFESTRVRDRA
jgi:hypothetical protein